MPARPCEFRVNSQGQANNNEAARQSPMFPHQGPLAFPHHRSYSISVHGFRSTRAPYAEKRHIRRAAGARMPCAFTIFADPADMAGTFRGGSRLLLATLHSGRAERSAGSPIRSFFRSRKTQRSSQSASRIRRAPFLRFRPKRSRWRIKTFSTKAALPNTPPSIR